MGTGCSGSDAKLEAARQDMLERQRNRKKPEPKPEAPEPAAKAGEVEAPWDNESAWLGVIVGAYTDIRLSGKKWSILETYSAKKFVASSPPKLVGLFKRGPSTAYVAVSHDTEQGVTIEVSHQVSWNVDKKVFELGGLPSVLKAGEEVFHTLNKGKDGYYDISKRLNR